MVDAQITTLCGEKERSGYVDGTAEQGRKRKKKKKKKERKRMNE